MALVLLGLTVPTWSAWAWGDLGHRAVALIAAERLNDKAQLEVEALLGAVAAQAMVDASTWADEIKGQRAETRPWHYVDIPIDDLTYRASFCPHDACVVAQIEHDVRILADKSLLKPVRAEALRLLIHFVGDDHQTLHCGDNHDRSGNEVKVLLNGRYTNLHAVWDADVVRALGTSDEERWPIPWRTRSPRRMHSTGRLARRGSGAWSRRPWQRTLSTRA